MDLLRRELEKKRKSVQADFGGRKFLKRSEIDQKAMQKLREEEQRSLLSKSHCSNPNTTTATTISSSSSTVTSSSVEENPDSSLPPALASAAAAASKKPLEIVSEEKRIDDLVLPRQDVIRQLRILKQPITLFGEDDDARLDRLKLTLKSGVLEIDSDMTEGQTNDFLRDIYELRKRQKSGSASSFLRDRAKSKRDDGDRLEDDGVDADVDKNLSGDGGSSGMDTDKDLKRMKAKFEDLCTEDKILVFFKRLLNEWNQELDEMPEADKRTAKGKSMVATFKQCARYLNPLFKFCRKKVCRWFSQ